GVPVVRCGGQEELVLEMGRDEADEARSQTLDCILAHGRCDGVSLVDDEQVEAARKRWMRRKHGAEKADALSLLGPIDRGDESRERCPWVGVETPLAPQSLDVVRVDDTKL